MQRFQPVAPRDDEDAFEQTLTLDGKSGRVGAAESAARIMRTERVNFFYDQLLVKEPATASRSPWHQDLPYWPIRGWQIASIWVPFDRVSPETGVVTYVKGSHLWGKMFRPRRFGHAAVKHHDDVAELEEAPDIDSRPWDFEFVTGVLEPGDVFIRGLGRSAGDLPARRQIRESS